jgi:metal-dependent hydrolase (beta-lactamase superfamily II)
MSFSSTPAPRARRSCATAATVAIDLGDVEAIAVTHGHWDHMGALPVALDAIAARRGRNSVDVHVNPGMFNERGILLADGTIFPAARVPTPPEMEARGARVISDGRERTLLDGHFYYSGEIPRVTSFETGRKDHLCRSNNEEEWRPDPHLMDERMLVANVRDLGLVVFSACSHAGIVNVCTEVRRLFPEMPIHAVMGGLHLGGVMESLIPQTVEGLQPFRQSAISSPATARAGAPCMRWPTPMARGSASPRWAPGIDSMPKRRRSSALRRHKRASRRSRPGRPFIFNKGRFPWTPPWQRRSQATITAPMWRPFPSFGAARQTSRPPAKRVMLSCVAMRARSTTG